MEEKKALFPNKILMALILPMMVELALKLIVGMIDSIMVSSAGEAAVFGVSLVDTVMQLVIYIFSAMAAGGAVVAGQIARVGIWISMSMLDWGFRAVMYALRWKGGKRRSMKVI